MYITIDITSIVYVGLSSMSQGVMATWTGVNQGFSNDDLNLFQTKYGLPIQNAVASGTTSQTSAQCASMGNCDEGNLDVQYIAGMCQVAKTYFFFNSGSAGDPWVSILNTVYGMSAATRPTVISISYGSDEAAYPPVYMDQFNTAAQKLGLLGVTIFVSSGDNGVTSDPSTCLTDTSSSTSSWKGTNTWTGQGYFPSWPATSQWVVAVGATNGPQIGKAEVASQPAVAYSYTTTAAYNGMGTSITSGGGFSSYIAQQTWQATAITNYLSAHTNISPGYNPKGRGYPDLAFMGAYYVPIVGGTQATLCGTSASTPMAAGMCKSQCSTIIFFFTVLP